jgi:type IV pilus assembly protein PilC
LSMLLGAGVPLTEGLSIVIRVADNEVYNRAVTRITTRVEKGFPLSECFAETEVFPTLVNQMIATGEATGKLDEVLMRVSDYFSKEAEEAVKGLTSAIEPLIMVMLGGVVGFMIVAVIMPIYDLTSQF